MQITVLGVNHSAPLFIREKVSFAKESIPQALLSLIGSGKVSEVVVLSTCNRTELVFSGGDLKEVEFWLADHFGLDVSFLSAYLYAWTGKDALHHVFRVACGLDSKVLGENQILGQLRNAVAIAKDCGTVGPNLLSAFAETFRVAKEVRSKTEIGAGTVSLSSSIVHFAEEVFGDLTTQKVLFVGAGEMIDACATRFIAKKPLCAAFANRTQGKAIALAERLGGEAIQLIDVNAVIASFDVVIVCTGSSDYIISEESAARGLADRQTPLLLIDLAVPRNIDPQAAELDGVILKTVDDIAEMTEMTLDFRKTASIEAERMVLQFASGFLCEKRSETVPVIRALRDSGERSRRSEIERATKALASGVNPLLVIEALSRRLTNKLLHAPCSALSGHDGREMTEVISQIWSLSTAEKGQS